jgi:hypothetical protein
MKSASDEADKSLRPWRLSRLLIFGCIHNDEDDLDVDSDVEVKEGCDDDDDDDVENARTSEVL